MNMHIEWTQNQARINELKAENAKLLEVINAHNKKMSEGVYTTNEQCAKEVAEHDRLLAENAAQAKRISELEIKKLDRHELTDKELSDQEYVKAYIESMNDSFDESIKYQTTLNVEIESLRKQVEELLGASRMAITALAHTSQKNKLYDEAYERLDSAISFVAASKNGE